MIFETKNGIAKNVSFKPNEKNPINYLVFEKQGPRNDNLDSSSLILSLPHNQ